MQKKLTIHFFVQSVQIQGTYFRFHNWALGLAALGHHVKVFGASYDKGDKSRIEWVDGIEYDITACYFPFQHFFGHYQHPVSMLKRLFKKHPPCDVAHVFQPNLSAFVPWYFNKKKAKQNVYDWDDLWTDGVRKKGHTFHNKWYYAQAKYLEKKGPACCDYITTCSNFLSAKAYNLGGRKTEILYNGYWHYVPNDKVKSRANMNLQPEAFYIGFMGRTDNEISWCFNLLRHVAVQYPMVRLALCGMSKVVLDNIEEPLKSRIDYLGALPPLATRDFASANDIGLLPLEDNLFNQSRFPIKFAEYLAANTPVLCTDVGECAELAHQFPFIKISPADNDSYIAKGIEMITQITTNQWPAVDKQKIDGILSWNSI